MLSTIPDLRRLRFGVISRKASSGGAVPVNVTPPSIDNTLPSVGDTLTASTGSWTNSPTSYDYVWKADGGNVGLDQNTYVVQIADAGKSFTVSVTASNGTGSSDPATSAATSVVGATPLQLNVAQWLKSDAGVYSDAGTTPANDGDTVEQWSDQSGNGNDVTQLVALLRGVFHTNQVNGLPDIGFDGSTTFFNNPYNGAVGTAVIIYYPDASGGDYQDLLGWDTTDAVAIGALYVQASAAALNVKALQATTSNTNGSDGPQFISQSTYIPNAIVSQWNLYLLHLELASIGLEINGQMFDTTANAIALRPYKSPGAIAAGYYAHTLTDYFKGKIAEVILFDYYLTRGQINALMAGYVLPRYNFPFAYPGPITYSYFWTGFAPLDATLHTQYSFDGMTWYNYPANYTPPSPDVVRDCSVFQDSNDLWWICHSAPTSSSFRSTYFDVASSPDRINWTFIAHVDCSSVTGTGDNAGAWAPEWFIDSDSSVHVIVALTADSSDTTSFVPYELHPTNSDFTAWSLPSQITGTSLPSMIDLDMVKIGSTYILAFKNYDSGNSGHVEFYTSTSPFSGFVAWHTGDFTGWGGDLEGPSMLNTSGSNWIIYLDNLGLGYYYATSTDNLQTFSAKTLVTAAVPMQHGTAVKLP